MKIPNCIDDFHETLLFAPLVVIAEVVLCLTLLWNPLALLACIVCDIFILVNYLVDWCYLSRTIVLDAAGFVFIRGTRTSRFLWQEANVQYVNNTGYLFGDSEISGPGVTISTKPIRKPPNIGAMTYCRFSHPNMSVFIRFNSSSDSTKKNAARFIYQGFSADQSEIMPFLETTGGSNEA